jgi:hypothetical protein
MPPRGSYSDIVRIVRGESGAVRLRMELTIRFGYGHTIPWVTRLEDGCLRAVAGPDMILLRTPAELHGEGHEHGFRVHGGGWGMRALRHDLRPLAPPSP